MRADGEGEEGKWERAELIFFWLFHVIIGLLT